MKKALSMVSYITGIFVIGCVITLLIITIFVLLNIENNCISINNNLMKDELFGKDIQIVIDKIGIPDKIIYQGISSYNEKEKRIITRSYPNGVMIYSADIKCLKKVAVNIFGGCRIYFNSEDKVTNFRKFLY